MATDIEKVRVHTADPYQYDRTSQLADGVSVDFQAANYPILPLTDKVYVNGVLKTRVTDYAIDNDLGLITFGAAPAGSANVVVTYKWSLLSDAALQILLDMNGANILLTSASALDVIASSEALIQKVITLLDLTTNGAAVAKALREHAVVLREQYLIPTATDDAGFEIAEMVYDVQTEQERIWKQWLRSGM